jgi:hypothetical protein
MVQGTIEDYCGGGVCADATYSIKDSANTTLYSGSIVSGGNLNQAITDGVITLKDSANATISTTNVKAQESKNITAPDGAVTVNTSSFGNVKSNGTLEVEVEYNDGTNVGTISGGKVKIPTNRINASNPFRTGQTTSFTTNDDGDLERGNGSAFTTLNQNNPFGNTNRFTDEVGGQTYTNNIVIDWANCDYVNSVVAGWYRLPISGGVTWANAMSGQPYSQNGYNWMIPNRSEANSIFNFEVASSRLNYIPFSLTSTVTAAGLWTSTTNPDSTTNAFRIAIDAGLGVGVTGQGINNLAKTSVANRLLFRYFTFAELGL